MNKPKISNERKLKFAVLYWSIVLGVSMAAMAPVASAHAIDIHNINAQVYGNETATDGFPAYLNNISQNGKMPQAMWLEVRAPGNSTFTLALNGTIIIQNQAFVDIANYSFTTKDTGNVPIQISVHSGQMNYTRSFTYRADILTVTSFISYEQSLHPKKTPSLDIGEAFIIFGPPAAAAVFSGILFADYWRGQKNSNPDMEDFLVGGHGNA